MRECLVTISKALEARQENIVKWRDWHTRLRKAFLERATTLLGNIQTIREGDDTYKQEVVDVLHQLVLSQRELNWLNQRLIVLGYRPIPAPVPSAGSGKTIPVVSAAPEKSLSVVRASVSNKGKPV